ncbi:hypothetical protein BCR36DRAFT_398356 [Piromyces finnis]|uniref:GIT Spa2 homology (SHD) domain-containing protein n=1 Tax=Piromyces finnis TaxID=1754191 RepID=A0A1Y1V6Q9_9FUNG|nr:hypothetical protein BCR36DRAFT_398356 [Piromyces finnis]|eukprot:ORX47905.1 hypothetical protein BCR36DRAFT_398356 [Piromyces finnis]
MSNDFYSPAIIKTHYLAFRKFLESQENDSKRQRGAKEKLIKLTNQQFQELSTDVYDELIRRTYNSRESECLQSQSEFQPKRNEARAKLAALSQPRFRDLSQDIYNEIQRRFPNIITEIENENQSEFNNHMSPVNNTMDNNNDNLKQGQSPYIQNQRLMPEQQQQQQQQQTPNQKINFAPLDDDKEAVDIEVAELRKANLNLKTKLDTLNEKYSTEKSRLEAELESVQETLTNRVKINEENATEYSKLYKNYTQLQNDIKTFRSQTEVNEKITEELRQENDSQIEKINELTKKNEKLENENKNLKEEIEKLKEELKKEKEKKPEIIEKIIEVPTPVKTEVNEKEVKPETPKKEPEEPQKKEDEIKPAPVSSSTPTKPIQEDEEIQNSPSIRDCINPERFNNYKEAVNELLSASKSDNPADVLVAMKSIVITCKNITEESDEYERLNENKFTFEEQEKIIEIKERLSVALTHLMNATKNHATRYPDVSPSFIESATSDLSVTIVSLVRTLKEHQNRILGIQSNKSSNQQLTPLQQQLPPINPKTMNMGEYTPNNEQVYNVHELKAFLEEKTDLIVQGIQSLLQKIQQPNASNGEFSSSIAYITDIVDNVIGASQNTFSSQAGIHLYENGELILQDLKRGNYHLKEMGASIPNMGEQEIKSLKSSLASASYEIAVFVRDLLELLG